MTPEEDAKRRHNESAKKNARAKQGAVRRLIAAHPEEFAEYYEQAKAVHGIKSRPTLQDRDRKRILDLIRTRPELVREITAQPAAVPRPALTVVDTGPLLPHEAVEDAPDPLSQRG